MLKMSGGSGGPLSGRYHGESHQLTPAEEEQLTLEQGWRQTQQLLVCVFTCGVVMAAWVLGSMGVSVAWLIGLCLLLLLVWRGKVQQIVEEAVKEEELRVHRKRALRQSETAEWLNFILNRWWVFSAPSIFAKLKLHLDPMLNEMKPGFLDSIELTCFTLGDQTPRFHLVKAYEYSDMMTNPRVATPENISTPPLDMAKVSDYQLVLEADVGLCCSDFKMIYTARLGGKMMGANIDVAVEKLNISGKMQFVLHMDNVTKFPHIARATICFIEKPEVWFSIRMMKAVKLMDVPVLKTWLHSLLMDGLITSLVDPGKMEIKLASPDSDQEFRPELSRRDSKAKGVLAVTLSSVPPKLNEFAQVFMEETRWCVLKLGEQKEVTQQTLATAKWQDTCAFLIDDLEKDKLSIKMKGRGMLATHTLAQYDLSLGSYGLEESHKVEEVLQKRGVNSQLFLHMEYTPLPPINLTNTTGLDGLMEGTAPKEESDQVAGVLYVHIHSGMDLVSMDRNGLSDPYCIVFCNKRKVKTTHYVCSTLNPSWESSVEFFVANYTEITLSFLVYDWDGRKFCNDDFLGSCSLSLAQAPSCTLRKLMPLGYGVGDRVADMGSITVSVVFRAVGSVAKCVDRLTQRDSESDIENAGSFNKQKRRFMASMSKFKQPDALSGVSQGHGLMELNILKGKDLEAKDMNGLSDPFCEVRIKNDLLFKSTVIKKSLNPVWDESVTINMPAQTETLDITVWDRDPFFMKEFMGSMSFSQEDIQRLSKEGPTWFELQRIKQGSIQLMFKVIYNPQATLEVEATSSEGLDMVSGELVEEEEDVFEENNDSRRSSQSSSIHQLAKSPSKEGSRQLESVAESSQSESDVPPEKPRMERFSSLTGMFRKKSLPRMNVLNTATDGATPSKKFPGFRLRKRSKSFQNLIVDTKETTSANGTASPIPPVWRYYNVNGAVLRARGLRGDMLKKELYCRLHFVSFNAKGRSFKAQQICKTDKVKASPAPYFDVTFQVPSDLAGAVNGSCILQMDIKNIDKQVVTRGSASISEILGDSREVRKWLKMDDDAEVEIQLYSSHHTSTAGPPEVRPSTPTRSISSPSMQRLSMSGLSPDLLAVPPSDDTVPNTPAKPTS
ncbi:MCTP1 [Branchiostoma lanceolatum]|uniref:MCTP1 protein n=1 Tax=Branchiostoma lanceolatum TaxID=7740 RepID=A0A8J9ZVT3_BRALA|nr:MCTP1 [Branchiostoma lanceolatum]